MGRRQSAIKAFFLKNTGSSALTVFRTKLVGRNRRDFVKTGDGCTVNLTAAGGGCLVNVRFRPKAKGKLFLRHLTVVR